MNIDTVRQLMNDTITAMENVMTEAKLSINESKSSQLSVTEAQRRLEERRAKLDADESRLLEEKRYLVTIRKQQEAKDVEQVTFTARRELVDKGMKELETKKDQITLAMQGLERKKKEIAEVMEKLEEKKKIIDDIQAQRQILLLREEEIKKREDADIERKRMLDFRENKLKTREARIQKYANLK